MSANRNASVPHARSLHGNPCNLFYTPVPPAQTGKFSSIYYRYFKTQKSSLFCLFNSITLLFFRGGLPFSENLSFCPICLARFGSPISSLIQRALLQSFPSFGGRTIQKKVLEKHNTLPKNDVLTYPSLGSIPSIFNYVKMPYPIIRF